MITKKYSEREQFYHIAFRVKKERKLSLREAWKITAKADKKVNSRILLPTYISFERFHIRYLKSERMVAKNAESEIKIEERHDFCGISEGQCIRELLSADGVHVNQLNRSGRSWIDVEEANKEKRLTTLLQEHERGKHAGKDSARKRKRARPLDNGIPKGASRKRPNRTSENARTDRRHE